MTSLRFVAGFFSLWLLAGAPVAGASQHVAGACSMLEVDAVAPALGQRTFQVYADQDAGECITSQQHVVEPGGGLSLACFSWTSGAAAPGQPDFFEVRAESASGAVLWRHAGACAGGLVFVNVPACEGYAGAVALQIHASRAGPLGYDADSSSGFASVGGYWCAA